MRILIFALKLVSLHAAEGVNSEIDASSCTSSTQYFDSMQFSCLECPLNQKADASGLNCICDDSSILDNGACVKCAAGQSPNRKATVCVPCDGSMDSSVEGQCTCDGKIAKEQEDNG